MATSGMGVSKRNFQLLNHNFGNGIKDTSELSELRIQLEKVKSCYRSSRVKLVELSQEIRLFNSLGGGVKYTFYQRRLEKYQNAHEIVAGEVSKYKDEINNIESRIEVLRTPSLFSRFRN